MVSRETLDDKAVDLVIEGIQVTVEDMDFFYDSHDLSREEFDQLYDASCAILHGLKARRYILRNLINDVRAEDE